MRGLKYFQKEITSKLFIVALYMGAWIEINCLVRSSVVLHVALYMGAWIEITEMDAVFDLFKVALYMGAWIEICNAL